MMTFLEKLYNNYYSLNNYDFVTHKEAKADPAKSAQREKYQADAARRHEEFKQCALAELEITDNPKAQRLFDIAWEEGHSYGYQAVWSLMETLVELIR